MNEPQPPSSSSDMNTESPEPVPKVIYGEDVDPTVLVDARELGQTMRNLGISDESIANSAVYIDPRNRLQTFGTHYPNRIGRLRFRSVPEIQLVKGDIVRLSTTVKNKARTDEEMNRTLVHELEHLAQSDRKDRRVTEGHLAIWGLAAAGAILGSRLGGNKMFKAAGTAVGAAVGHSLGYLMAPHERQARKRAGQGRKATPQVTTDAVSRNSR